MPVYPIFEIDELVRLIIDKLVKTSPRAAVSFALTCRSLEEPTLSSLWERQESLVLLLSVVPCCTLVREGGDGAIVSSRDFPVYRIRYKFPQAFEHDPSAKDWARLHRYASWMRKLCLDHNVKYATDTLLRLSSNSPGGLLFPKLESLAWNIYKVETPLLFSRLFLSPHLQSVTVTVHVYLTAENLVAGLTQMISLLPTSLGHLSVMCKRGNGLHDAVSSC